MALRRINPSLNTFWSYWLKSHVQDNDRVLREHDLADMDIWKALGSMTVLLSSAHEQHIYSLDAPDYHKIQVCSLGLAEPSHQGDEFGMREIVPERDNEIPQSASSYGTRPNLDINSVRNRDTVIEEPHAGETISLMSESHQYLTESSSREPWLYRCPTCHKPVETKRQLKYIIRIHILLKY
jgi:hypothetical protein